MVLAATLELVPMVAAALVAAAAMVATGCIGPNEARKSIEWETLLLIAASFGLARAIEKTGLDELLAQSTIGAAGDRPHLVLAAIYFVTMLFTETMSNNAAAVLIFPIAWQTATDLGLKSNAIYYGNYSRRKLWIRQPSRLPDKSHGVWAGWLQIQ